MPNRATRRSSSKKWHRHSDGTYTYTGYGRTLSDAILKGLLLKLASGDSVERVANKHKIPEGVIRDILVFFRNAE